MPRSLGQFTKKSLMRHKLFPKKWLGQSFLVDKNAIGTILRAADIRSNDIILEVGPGTGNLTAKMAPLSRKVIAIEKDHALILPLKKATKDFKNVKIIQGDILKFTPGRHGLGTRKYKIVANLPYYISSAFLRKFLESNRPPREMVLVLQKEVAKRIVARPPKMNLLAVSVQFFAKPKITAYLSKKLFWPQPKVNSAVIRLKVNARRPAINSKLFFKIVRAGFSHPRKKIGRNLSKYLKVDWEVINNCFSENKISPKCRAENLSIENWQDIIKALPSND